MRREHASRFLAVDVRSGRFGYAMFETPGELLDSGIARFSSPEAATARVFGLCEMFRPSLMVIRKESARRGRSYPRANAVRRALRKEVMRQSIPISAISERRIDNWFRQHGKAGKYAIASSLADQFPQLSWKLPPRRKPWQPEPWCLCLFDAVALGVVYIHLNSVGNHDAPFAPR